MVISKATVASLFEATLKPGISSELISTSPISKLIFSLIRYDFCSSILAMSISVKLAILFAINLQTSFLTPPFGFSLFYLRGVADQSIQTAEIYRGVIPFIGIQLLVLLLVIIFPILIW